MPRNKLEDLNNHLFEQLERLNDDDLDAVSLDEEISRSKAMTGLATAIIENAHLALDGQKFIAEYGNSQKALPDMLKLDDKYVK